MAPLAVLPDLDHCRPPYPLLLHNVFILVPTVGLALSARLRARNDVLLTWHYRDLLPAFTPVARPVTGAGVPCTIRFQRPPLDSMLSFSTSLPTALCVLPEPSAAFGQSELLDIALTSLALAVIVFVKNRLSFEKDVLTPLKLRLISRAWRVPASSRSPGCERERPLSYLVQKRCHISRQQLTLVTRSHAPRCGCLN